MGVFVLVFGFAILCGVIVVGLGTDAAGGWLAAGGIAVLATVVLALLVGSGD
jgi:hypothetical protein